MCCSYGISSPDISKISNTSWSGLSTVAGEGFYRRIAVRCYVCAPVPALAFSKQPPAIATADLPPQTPPQLFALVLPGVYELKAENQVKKAEHYMY